MTSPEKIEELLRRLWPLNRSLTGTGVQETLKILGEIMPIEIFSFPSGEQVFDWIVPKEWNVEKAYFEDCKGKRWADYSINNLHLIGYSEPFHGQVSRKELMDHVFTLEDQPDAIPYVTSYYKKRWGFCLSYNDLRKLKGDSFNVNISTSKFNGSLLIGESFLKGRLDDEILFSSYICHPSMANNELSGPVCLVYLYYAISKIKNRKYSYRFVLAPETIGALCYLKKRGEHLRNFLSAGYLLTCLGGGGAYGFKKSRKGDSVCDRTGEFVMCRQKGSELKEFDPIGSDERQYCSPGFNLPVGSIYKTLYGEFPEYHTSLDNLKFLKGEQLVESLTLLESLVDVFEKNAIWISTNPFGEPFLTKHKLYPDKGTVKLDKFVSATMWVLNLCDGENDLISICQRSGCDWEVILEVVNLLSDKDLITEVIK
jgi:aminopeptidase-like protein